MQPSVQTRSEEQPRGASQRVQHRRLTARALRYRARSRTRRGLFASIIVATMLVVFAPDAGAAHAVHPDMLARAAHTGTDRRQLDVARTTTTPTWTLTTDLTPIPVWPSAGANAASWTLLADLTPVQVRR